MATGSFFALSTLTKALSTLWAPLSHVLSAKEVIDIFRDRFGNRSPKASDTPATTAAAAAAAEAIRTRASVQARRRYLNLDAIRWLEAEELTKLTAVLQVLADFEKEALFDSLGIEESVQPQAAPRPAPAGQAPVAAAASPQPVDTGNLRGREVLKGILKAGDTAEIVALLRATGLLGQPAEPSALKRLAENAGRDMREYVTKQGGKWDTASHELFAWFLLRRYTVRRRTGAGYHSAYDAIMESQAVIAWKEKIDAEPDINKRRTLHEDYQKWLQGHVTNWLDTMKADGNTGSEPPTGENPLPEMRRAQKQTKPSKATWVMYVTCSLLIAFIIAVGSFQALGYNPRTEVKELFHKLQPKQQGGQ